MRSAMGTPSARKSPSGSSLCRRTEIGLPGEEVAEPSAFHVLQVADDPVHGEPALRSDRRERLSEASLTFQTISRCRCRNPISVVRSSASEAARSRHRRRCSCGSRRRSSRPTIPSQRTDSLGARWTTRRFVRSPCPARWIWREHCSRCGAAPATHMRIGDDEAWRATRTPDGPATLHVAMDRSSAAVLATAWGPGAAWALERAPDLAGMTTTTEDSPPSMTCFGGCVVVFRACVSLGPSAWSRRWSPPCWSRRSPGWRLGGRTAA